MPTEPPKLHGHFRVPAMSLWARSGVRGDGTVEPRDEGLRVVGTWARPSAFIRWALLCGFLGAVVGTSFNLFGFSALSILIGLLAGTGAGLLIGRAGPARPLDVTLPWVKLDDMQFDGATYQFRASWYPSGSYILDVADAEQKKLAASLVNVWLRLRFGDQPRQPPRLGS